MRALEENSSISGVGLRRRWQLTRAPDKDWEGAPETPMSRTTQGRRVGAGPEEELRACWKSHGVDVWKWWEGWQFLFLRKV